MGGPLCWIMCLVFPIPACIICRAKSKGEIGEQDIIDSFGNGTLTDTLLGLNITWTEWGNYVLGTINNPEYQFNDDDKVPLNIRATPVGPLRLCDKSPHYVVGTAVLLAVAVVMFLLIVYLGYKKMVKLRRCQDIYNYKVHSAHKLDIDEEYVDKEKTGSPLMK